MTKDASIPWSSLGPLMGVFSWWLLGMLVYAVRSSVKGRHHERRLDQVGGTRLLSTWLLEYGYWMINWLGRVFVRLGVSPNVLTTLSLITAIASAWFLFIGWFGLGGWLMITSALFDVFDGMVARQTGVASEAGEYFDSVVDRYCELFGFIALMGYYFPSHPLIGGVVGLAMVASLMITFNRAKGEAQGVTDVPSGLMRRHERLFYIGVGTAASPLLAVLVEPGATRPVYHLAVGALGLVALVGNITAIRLAIQIHRRLNQDVAQSSASEAASAEPASVAAEAGHEPPVPQL